jgi:hypothetical protein
VESKPGFCQIMRKVCLLAVFGLLAITLAGPILSLFFVVLSFALIGFLFWLPIHLLIYGKDGAVRDSLNRCCAIMRRGGHVTGAVWHGTIHLGRELHEALRGTASVLGAVLLETLSGAVVGLLLAATCWPHQAANGDALGMGASLGALTGLLVVLSRWRRAAEPAVEQSEPAA